MRPSLPDTAGIPWALPVGGWPACLSTPQENCDPAAACHTGGAGLSSGNAGLPFLKNKAGGWAQGKGLTTPPPAGDTGGRHHRNYVKSHLRFLLTFNSLLRRPLSLCKNALYDE